MSASWRTPLAVVATASLMCGVDPYVPPSQPSSAPFEFDVPLHRVRLPSVLDEVSGLAFTADGRLFTHDDELGVVYQIDPMVGSILKRFQLGSDPIRADFEGIAIVGERFFLVTSSGQLVEFIEGADQASVEYTVKKAPIGPECEVEGLDYDPVDGAMLIPCKEDGASPDEIVITRLPLAAGSEPLPQLRIPLSSLLAHGAKAKYNPSAIAVTAQGWFLSSGRQESILHMTRDGEVLGVYPLDKERHPQPEGLALDAQGVLLIADEAHGENPWLTAYAPASTTQLP